MKLVTPTGNMGWGRDVEEVTYTKHVTINPKYYQVRLKPGNVNKHVCVAYWQSQ